jgi:ApbE superfamily uncharacterized protein (UPF0280 family)
MPLRHHFELRETIATILADDQSVIDAACEGIRTARHEIERYILSDPFFEMSYEPVVVKEAPDIIQKMADAAEKAKVGPMAAVAGAVAYAGVRAAQNAGALYCIIDNGGDIAMISDRPVRVGLYAGRSPLSGRYAFSIPLWKKCTAYVHPPQPSVILFLLELLIVLLSSHLIPFSQMQRQQQYVMN